MRENNDYKKASLFYLIGTLFNKGIVFLTVPIFTRILSTFDYGIVNTYNSWIAIITMCVGFALHMSIRMAVIDYKDNIDEVISSIAVFTLLSTTIAIVLAMILFDIVKIDINRTLVVLCILQASATAILNDYTNLLMMQYRYKFRTLLMVLPNLLSTIIAIPIICYCLDDTRYLGRIIPTASINVFVCLIILILIFKRSKVFEKKYIKYALAISMPLIVHGIALNILSQSDRTMITLLVGADQTGIYSLIFNFSMIAVVFTSALEGVWVPWFTEKMYERKIIEINNWAYLYSKLMGVMLGVLVLVAPEMVKMMASSEYWKGIEIIPPIILENFIIFAYGLCVNVEHYYKRSIYITINTVIAAACNIILNFLFIPKYGYVGAAYATLTSYIVSFFLHMKYTRKIEKTIFPFKIFVRPLLEIVVTTVIFYIFIETMLIRWVYALIYLSIEVYLERETVKSFLPNIMKNTFN